MVWQRLRRSNRGGSGSRNLELWRFIQKGRCRFGLGRRCWFGLWRLFGVLFCLGVALGWQVVEIDISELNDIRTSRDLQPVTTKNGNGGQRERHHEQPELRCFLLTQ